MTFMLVRIAWILLLLFVTGCSIGFADLGEKDLNRTHSSHDIGLPISLAEEAPAEATQQLKADPIVTLTIVPKPASRTVDEDERCVYMQCGDDMSYRPSDERREPDNIFRLARERIEPHLEVTPVEGMSFKANLGPESNLSARYKTEWGGQWGVTGSGEGVRVELEIPLPL